MNWLRPIPGAPPVGQRPEVGRHWHTALGGALILACCLAAYWPALHAGFIWNDPDYVTAPALRSLAGLRRIWFEIGATQQYYPVLHTAFWLEHRLWGDAPLGYHLFNVLVHAGCACLIALVLGKIFSGLNSKTFPKIETAWIAGLLFALHPICVESVAWISEEKNTLSTAFYLLAALIYLDWLDQGRSSRGRYLAATGCFVLALLSKSVTATLPAALLVVVCWREGKRLGKSDWLPLVPWVALGAAFGLFTAWVENHYVGAHGAEFALTLPQRCALAGHVVWFYLGKLVGPVNLMFIYPRWPAPSGGVFSWTWLVAILGVTALLWRASRLDSPGGPAGRAAFAAWGFFCVGLFPVMGFLNVYAFRYSFVADHWQYLPAIGGMALAAGLLVRLAPPFRRTAAAVILCVLGILAWRQCRDYHDAETLYRATLRRNPDCWMASQNLGGLMLEQGRVQEAIAQFEATLRIDPDFADAENNLGIAFEHLGKPDQALDHYRRALSLNPDFGQADANLGQLLLSLNRNAEALAPLQAAVRSNAGFAAGLDALGVCLSRLGRVPEAIDDFQRAIRIDANRPQPHDHLGVALAMTGQSEPAIAELRRAIELWPGYADAHFRLALLLWRSGRPEEALAEKREALRLDPSLPP